MEKPDPIKTIGPTPKESRLMFNAILDEACCRLWNMRVSYSIEKISKLQKDLDQLAEELDAFIARGSRDGM